MAYTIQNETLRVTAAAQGAELTSVWHIPTGTELLWQADPAWWPRHAPLLFPHCGKLYGGRMVVNGKEYPANQHGFARDAAFEPVSCEGAEMVLRLTANEETRAVYPFDFTLTVTYTLAGATLRQKVEVACPGDAKEALPFNLGFHPGFALPFSPGKRAADYELVFSNPETPVVVETPNGLVSGKTREYFQNQTTIPLTDNLFSHDSLCFKGLTSETLTLRDKTDHSKFVQVNISGFPYVLVWGPPHGPLPFVCIEPWHGLPDPDEDYGSFQNKPGLQTLAPGESFDTTLKMTFGR